MLNIRILEQVEEGYLDYLPVHFKDESFKWKAIQHFQKNWDIDAPDFAAMLERALAKTSRLLQSGYYFARSMLLNFAKEDPEGLRAQFRMLYDETQDLGDRAERFIAYADDRKQNHNATGWKNHYQDTKSVSVYLWLRYPDRYYIYKYGEVRPSADFLECSFKPQRTGAVTNMIGAYHMCDEIHDHLVKNQAILDAFHRLRTPDCYPDPQYRTLAFDVVFYISRYYLYDAWFPAGYSPNLSVEDWSKLLANPEVFQPNSLAVMKRMLDIGGQASCVELAQKYGEKPGFYSFVSSSLAERVIDATGCTAPPEYENAKYWPVLYLGKRATKQENGIYIWRLRRELRAALEQTDLSGIPLYAEKKAGDDIDDGNDNGGDQSIIPVEPEIPIYTRADFLSEVFMPEEKLDQLIGLVKRKKNVILQGAPGVGKTFTAKRLAWLMLGCKDEARIASVQFHQSYSYEDFIMGYKPDGEAFALQTGIFYDFCKKADNDPEHDYFFIIDEINRGNLSKIFGELLQLIEADNRGSQVLLAYNHESFGVPENLYLIGMMNTADRSLALIDYALRRRFSFFEMNPGFGTDGFRKYAATIHDENFGPLVDKLIALNREIEGDPTLGRGFRIGHSYLCLTDKEEYSEDWLQSVVEYDIIPTLREYWFDNSEKLKKWEDELRGVFNV